MSHSVNDSANDSVPSLSIQEIVTLILKAKGIHEGFYVPQMELGFGAGAEEVDNIFVPAIKVAIKRIGIAKVDSELPSSVNAALVNPRPKPRARKEKVE
ncbi:hypothetical protein [Alkanindiges illinoisensis]|uniref:hypothetical protein n=1 Tax=Alkanindiges illinoisensis TaxID=197183 RepID=UPI00047A7E91|nr:hypothetical protein [Alkanindiges illinoisensis]